MEQNTQTTPGTEAAARPVFLTVLCILSFIFSGLGLLGLILLLVGMGAVQSVANAVDASGATITSTGPSMAMTWAYLIVGFLTTLIGLYGVIKMWKLQKVGFYIYTGCVVISFVMGIIYSGFGFMGLLPMIFVVLYGLNLKAMK